MTNITLKQLRSDFKYLEDNLSDYAIDDDGLVNVVAPELLSGEMDIKDFVLWCIKDIISYAVDEMADEDDIEFLETDKRAQRILKRYDIEL